MNEKNMNDTNETGRDGFGCDSFAKELSLFVFGELEGERLAGLEQHLIGCAACRSERDALQRSLELLKSDGAKEQQPQLSAERQANLLAQASAQAQVLAQTVVPSSGHFIRLSRLAIAAGLIATAGASWYAWQVHRASSSPTTDLASVVHVRSEPAASRNPTASTDLNGAGYTVNQIIDPSSPPASAPKLAGDLVEAEVPATISAAGVPATENLDAGLEAVVPANGRVTLAEPQGDEGESMPAAAADPMSLALPAGGRAAGRTPKAEEARSSAAHSALARRLKQSPNEKRLLGLKDAGSQTSTGGAGSTSPSGTTKAFYVAPDGAGDTTLDDFGTIAPLMDEDEMWSGRGGTPADGRESLRSLGYLADDAGAAAPRAPLDPAVVGRILAATCAPSDVVRFQAHVAAALGIDPAHPSADLEKSRDTIVREFLNHLSRRQNEPPRDMFFRYFGDHPFVPTRIDNKSTFGMDVDTASYTLARAYLTKGILPPKAAVRTEEFVNAFKHDLAPPKDESNRDRHGDAATRSDDQESPRGRDVFAIHTEIAPSPFGEEGQLLLQVGLKARVISKEARKPVALTFIIDVSGSMEQDGRLELVKQSLRLLVNQLDERDTIGIVSFETTAHRILDPVNATKRAAIFASLDRLRPEGSTDVEEGLKFGYAMALEQLRPNAENRVILCSDGVANTGVTDPKLLSARIDECKAKYIYLNCIGVGFGNHNDSLMEQLADEGDGFCAYVDKIEEAKKLFVERLTGTLLTVARNAKIQVEFDPANVRRFRQIGYEKRALAHRDFRNDQIDAGEVGAGQEVVALYEIEPKEKAAGPLATVRIRYEDPDVGAVHEQARPVFVAEVAESVQKTTPRFRLSACVAEFAEILRQSVHARDGSFGAIEHLAEPLVDELKGDADVPEFVALVKQAARLPDLLPPRNEMVRAVDELKKLHCWREELNDSNGAKDAADESLMRQLEEQNRKLEQALRDSLDRALRHS